MKIYNGKPIIVGLIIFVGILMIPFWYGLGRTPSAPQLSVDTPEIRALAEKRCVESTPYMRANHMELLNTWRNTVVREGRRWYLSSSGKEVPMSLSQSCLSCHSNKEQFCDRCHNYASVQPNCFRCHSIPKEKS